MIERAANLNSRAPGSPFARRLLSKWMPNCQTRPDPPQLRHCGVAGKPNFKRHIADLDDFSQSQPDCLIWTQNPATFTGHVGSTPTSSTKKTQALACRSPRSSSASPPRSPAPVQAETGAVPADDGLRLHDDQDVAPAWPQTAECRPEESVQRVQYRPRPLAFENGDLLSKGEDFKGRVASALTEDADHREHGKNEFRHEFTLVTRRNAVSLTQSQGKLKLLIPEHHGVLSTHTHNHNLLWLPLPRGRCG